MQNEMMIGLRSQRVGQALIDDAGTVIQCNSCFSRLIGIAEERVKGQKLAQLLSIPALQPLQSQYLRFNAGRENQAQQQVLISSGTTIRSIAVEWIRLEAPHSAIVLQLIDLTDSAEWARVGTRAKLAQRVAHKAKTPLASVSMALQLLQRSYRKNSPDRVVQYDEFSATGFKAIDRVRDYINTLMKLVKLDLPILALEDFSPLVQEALQEYSTQMSGRIKLQTQLDASEMMVEIDRGQFKELLCSVLDSTLMAIPGEGEVALKTIREVKQAAGPDEPDQALLEISDHGNSLNESDLNDLLTTGFTTSERGMGLVLAKCVIESQGGSIDIRSSSADGTAVQIRMPIRQTGKGET